MDTFQILSAAMKIDGMAVEIPNTEPGICCVTGKHCDTIPRKDMLGASFTAQACFKAPQSDRIGIDAYIAMQDPRERKSSWMATENGMRWLRETVKKDVRSLVINGGWPEGWWALYVTTTWKKHGALVAPPCNGASHPMMAYNDETIDLADNSRVTGTYNKLYEAKTMGIGNTMLETLEFQPAAYKAGLFTIQYWTKFIKWAKPIYLSPLYRLCLWMLPSADELKASKEMA